MIYRAGLAAATIHGFMCLEPGFGYTQGADRWGGSGKGRLIEFSYMGFTFKIPIGDYDCSSSVVRAWQLALEPTKYRGALGHGGYNSRDEWVSWYTGNIESGFRESGLFQSKSLAYLAEPGDLYLNKNSHVAMCQTQTPDMLSEFLLNEHGGITGGQPGDQTGDESIIRPYYDFPWDCIMHYSGKADFEIGDDMTPDDVWNFELNGVKARDRLIGTDIAANAARAALTDKKDASGRGKNADVATRLAYMADKQESMMRTLDQVLKEVAHIESVLVQLKDSTR